MSVYTAYRSRRCRRPVCRARAFAVGGCLTLVCMALAAGREVSVQVPFPASDAELAGMGRTLALLKRSGADGGVLMLGGGKRPSPQQVGAAVAQGTAAEFPLWVAVEMKGSESLAGVGDLVPDAAAGLVVFVPGPAGGEALPKTDFAGLLLLKRRGDRLGQAIRELKRSLAPGRKLAIAAGLREMAPETARGVYVPVRDLVRDGTVDVVCVNGASQFNCHRLRLLRDARLAAGTGLDVSHLPAGKCAGVVQRMALESLKNKTGEFLWLFGERPQVLVTAARSAVEGWKREQKVRSEIEAAVARGELVIDQEVPAEKCNDQASVHGVAQSFVPSRNGTCPLVQLYAALRGCKGQLPPPLQVEVREDAEGKPGAQVLVRTAVDPTEFGHEPVYRWVNARFGPPVSLSKGKRYWIYLPPATSEDGSYVWRIIKNGATDRGAAWSRRYKYGTHTWVYRVYLNKE